ncbi:hypothetical protein AUP68_04849 [Ilyonectria robusta]
MGPPRCCESWPSLVCCSLVARSKLPCVHCVYTSCEITVLFPFPTLGGATHCAMCACTCMEGPGRGKVWTWWASRTWGKGDGWVAGRAYCRCSDRRFLRPRQTNCDWHAHAHADCPQHPCVDRGPADATGRG